MNYNMKPRALYLSAACFLLILAYIVQCLGSLNSDVASLLYDTKLILMGGTYVKDFFETNPPLILYLYAPVILIGKVTSFNLASIFRAYVIFLVLISVTCCVKLLEQIFVKRADYFIFKIVTFILFFILLFLPASEFGQREHFLMILMLPYLFSAVLAAQNKEIPRFFAVLIGVMAGLGFGLKPYFLLPVIFIELYFIFTRRYLLAWVRVESVTCLIVLIIYLSSIFIFQEDYIKIMLPLISHLYFVSIEESWSLIFFRPSVIFCCLAWGYFFIFNKNNQRELATILMLALTGMIAAFIVPRSAWYYHVLPALSLACLLVWLYIYCAITTQFKGKLLSKIDVCILIAASLLMFTIPFVYYFFNTEKAIMEKNSNHFHLLTTYINSLPQPQKLYCFSANTTMDCFPLVYQTHSAFAGRFPLFWWLRGLVKMEIDLGKHPLPPLIAKDKRYLIDVIADDLNRYHPNIIIVNKLFTGQELGNDFDFISYFSGNVKFRAAWRHYHYLKTINVYQLYVRS